MLPLLDHHKTGQDITRNIFYSIMKSDLDSLLESGGIATVPSTTMQEFADKMRDKHYNYISMRSSDIGELYMLHMFCKTLYTYNETVGLTYNDYRSKVIIPNIMYSLVKHFTKAHDFIKRSINVAYNDIRNSNVGVIQKFINSYYLDEDIIKTDVLYSFLGNQLRRLNPLIIEKPIVFYRDVFRNIFSYYFKSELKHSVTYCNSWDVDVKHSLKLPTRLEIYRDVLHKLQVRKYIEEKKFSTHLLYNYTIFRDVIHNNELQSMYFASISCDSNAVRDNKYKLLKIYASEKDIMEEIKELPLIYRLLKCVHIHNPLNKPYDEGIVKPKMVKIAILEELMSVFGKVFDESHVLSIIDKISENFTKSVLSGEYVNIFTLSEVKITQISFITQIRKFVRLCLMESIK